MAAADGPMTGRAPVTLMFSGRLDAVRAPELRDQVDRAVAAAPAEVVVDLADAVFVDSAALAVLVRLRRECLAAGIGLTLVRPDAEDAMRIFRLTQFDEVFTMVAREDAP